jgi:putative ABC transport system permease protein
VARNGFSMSHLLWNNLLARPLRTALSVVAVALQVTFVLLIVGMTLGVVSDWGKRVEGVGADILVQPPNASIFFQFTNAVLQESLGDTIASVPGVDQVAPVLVIANARNLEIVYGIDFQSFSALSQGFVFRSGRAFESADELILDDIQAEKRKLRVGDHLSVFNRNFTVCGIVAHGKGARSFIPLATAQEISGAEKRVTLFYVRSTGDTERTRQAIVQKLPGHLVRSMQDYLTLMNSSNLPGMQPFLDVMVVIGVSISFLVVLLTMHTMVLERTREIGILKALGISRSEVARLFLGESVLMAGLGVILGLGATFLTRWILRSYSPGLIILITAEWLLRSVALAFLGALLGAVYPAIRASGCDPVDALAFE